jgi:ATP-dependent protease ClpP protease subunit
MQRHTHAADKLTRYRGSWDALYYIHEYNIDPEKREIYLFPNEEYIEGPDPNDEPGVEYSMTSRFIKNMRILMSLSDEPILVHMKTCGGDWVEGMAMYDMIRACPNHVTVLSYTHARSMSSLVLLAADRRVLMPESMFMFHRGEAALVGTSTQVDTQYEQQKLADERMVEIYVAALRESERFAGMTDKKIAGWVRQRMREKEDVYLTAAEAVAHNFADEVFGANGVYDWAALRSAT